jgi:hypothetical protein
MVYWSWDMNEFFKKFLEMITIFWKMKKSQNGWNNWGKKCI